MNDNLERNYWMQLHANLINASPIDTHNMQTHIVMYEDADNFVIEVNAPFNTRKKLIENKEKSGEIISKKARKKTNKTKQAPKPKSNFSRNNVTDYAYDVNYASKSPHNGWIENQINQTARIVNARVTYLGE